MKRITNIIRNTYYRYNPNEFFPIYSEGHLTNAREFHSYRIKWLIHNYQTAWHEFTHQRG